MPAKSNLTLHILGCGSATPSRRHLPACQVVEHNRELLMIDCGEGAQRSMMTQGLNFTRLRHIFISHLHGDHCLGLPGLLSTLSLHQMGGTLTVHTFKEGAEIFSNLVDFFCRERSFDLQFNIIDPTARQTILDTRSLTVEAFPMHHRVPTVGFLLREKPKPRHIIADAVKFFNVPVAQMKSIKDGADFVTPDGTVIVNSRLTRDADRSASYAYCSDTLFDRSLEASGTSGEKAEMNGVLNFSVLDGWWYEGYRFNEKAGWALTDKRTYTDQAQQDKLDAATIYSMLENEIIPLYFKKNSAGYSPEWIQYIKGSIGDIAPHFTMKRMIDDYISRFYDPEAKRNSALAAHDYAKAKEIVAWKEKVAAAWDGIKVFDVRQSGDLTQSSTGESFKIEAIVDTNGLGRDLGLEMVVYRQEDGQEHLLRTVDFKVVKEEGNVLTYELSNKLKDAGVFRYGFRLYPKNPALPHRMDFAFTRWI